MRPQYGICRSKIKLKADGRSSHDVEVEKRSYATSVDEILTTVKGISLFESILCPDNA